MAETSKIFTNNYKCYMMTGSVEASSTCCAAERRRPDTSQHACAGPAATQRGRACGAAQLLLAADALDDLHKHGRPVGERLGEDLEQHALRAHSRVRVLRRLQRSPLPEPAMSRCTGYRETLTTRVHAKRQGLQRSPLPEPAMSPDGVGACLHEQHAVHASA